MDDISKYLSEMGSKGGKSKSIKKINAARNNIAKARRQRLEKIKLKKDVDITSGL